MKYFIILYAFGAIVTAITEYVGGEDSVHRGSLSVLFGIIWPITWIILLILRMKK